MEKIITHGSTFSGIGAPEVAAEMLGWENIFHCEINPFGRKVLDYYFPNAESYEDITKTDFTKWRDKVTVLTGGFPCQPFSYAGKRRGSEDDRYLWPFMLRCIEQVRPRWFVGENVAGITTMAFPGEDVKVGASPDKQNPGLFDELFASEEQDCNSEDNSRYKEFRKRIEDEYEGVYRITQNYVLDEICSSLEKIGYSVQPMLIPACAVGAPHRRDRVFIVAHRNVADTEDMQRNDGIVGNGANDKPRSTEPRNDNSTKARNGHTSYTPSHRRREIYEQVQSKLADGEEPFGNGRERNVTDTQCEGLEGDASVRVQGHERRGVCDGIRKCPWTSRESLQPKQRWRTFPSVSPVYRGNDGLPFPLDNLTIPFSEWKRESLKAYGNAIVPQVMYEIFRIIDLIENEN